MNAKILLTLTALVQVVATADAKAQTVIRVENGVEAAGRATPLWLELLRRRLDDAAYDSAAAIQRPRSAAEMAWAELIAAHADRWPAQVQRVARTYAPAAAPDTLRVVLGNRGASDAFTHDERTVAFDLSALVAGYGEATRPGNAERIDRLFRHEAAHVLQKAWLALHPYAADTPLRLALLEMWKEGLGNFHSLSERWRRTGERHSETAARTLRILEPRWVARVAAITCADDVHAAALKADLSRGRFDHKWGAVAPALWLEAEGGERALRDLVLAGPDGVLELAERQLPPALAATVSEIRALESLCPR